MPGPLIRVENVSLFIPGEKSRKIVLANINLDIDESVHIALIGKNGSGKTSLLRLLNGNLWPASGKIYWRDDSQYSDSPLRAREICALVSPLIQEDIQHHLENLPVCEYWGNAASSSWTQLCARLRMEHLTHKPLGQLSQGQIRLAMLVKALAKKPRLLLLDEAADGLDFKHRDRLFELLHEYSGNTAMIFATHREDTIPHWVKGRLFIDKGRLCETRHPPAIPPVKEPDHPTLSPCIEQPVFNLENISVYINRKLVLKNIFWKMRKGENWQIYGENGSGKSTFLRLLAGDECAAHGGKLEFISNNENIIRLEDKRRRIKLVSDLSQTKNDYPLSGLELVLSGIENSIGIYRHFSEDEIRKAGSMIRLFLPEFNPDEIGNASIRRLSTGQLRRLFLARALMGRPEILLLDEPFTGLDAESRSQIINALCMLWKKEKSSPQIIMVSHYQEDIPPFINRRAAIINGALICHDQS